MKIETERLLINNLTLEDAKAFSNYRNKEEVAKYQSWDSYSLKKAIKRIEYCLKNPFNGELGNYQIGIYLKDTKQLIGDLFIEVSSKTTITLGYTLDSLYWSNGYAYEALEALFNYLKANYAFKICLCHVYEENTRSINLLKKHDFIFIHKSWFYQDLLYRKKL